MHAKHFVRALVGGFVLMTGFPKDRGPFLEPYVYVDCSVASVAPAPPL